MLSSCAIVIPVFKPDLSKSDFNQLVEDDDPKVECYRRGIRGWTVAADALLFFPMIVDGVLGQYTYYYFDPVRCKEAKARKNVKVIDKESTRSNYIYEEE